MRKFLIGSAAGAIMLATMAVPAFADPPGGGEQPGYDVASGNTDCAGAGAFGYFGTYGAYDSVHDVDRTTPGVQGYDEFADGNDDNVGQGAEGGVDGGTGERNSNNCGSPQHDW